VDCVRNWLNGASNANFITDGALKEGIRKAATW